jgi:exopolysaccharide biosynthesis polyprenyl glycosylphosphotransferase
MQVEGEDMHVKRARAELGGSEDASSSAYRVSLPYSERQFLLWSVDALLINGAVLFGFWAWQAVNAVSLTWDFVTKHGGWFPILMVAWWGFAWLFDLYDVNVAGRRLVVVQQVAVVILLLLAGYLLIYFFLPPRTLPRLFFLFFAGAAFLLLTVWRSGYALLFSLPELKHRVLVVGAGWAGQAFVQILQEQEETDYRVIGFVDDDPDKRTMDFGGVRVIGDSRDLLHLVARHRVDKLVLAITDEMQGELFQRLVDCRAQGVQVVHMPDLYQRLTRQVPVEHVNKGWVLNAMNSFTAVSRLEQVIRRTSDLALTGVGFVGLGIALPFVALAIALDDGGPLFYRQVRSGRAGEPFFVVKFRTMRPDAEKDGKPRWAKKDDDRVTRVGKVLRKTRLDELPQIINVLRGEMHIVGPRPERPEFIAELEEKIPFYRTRLTVKPGLTGWAQIHYKYGNSVEDALVKLQYDLYYIRNRSLWLDFYIVFKTIGVVFRLEGT